MRCDRRTVRFGPPPRWASGGDGARGHDRATARVGRAHVSGLERFGRDRRRTRPALPPLDRWRAVHRRPVRAVPGRFAATDPGRRSGGLIVFGYHGRYLRVDVTAGRVEFI